MLGQDQIDQVQGSTAYGSNGEKIGSVGQIYLDDQSGQPAWVTVNTGLFGTSESFVPLSEASYSGDRLTLPYDKDKIKGAPNVAEDGHISPEEEQTLYEYYGMSYSGGYTETETTTTRTADMADTTDDSVTLSEEQLRVGKATQQAGQARLRKYVVSENVTETVPLTKERAVLQREPITDGDTVTDAAFAEDSVEVNLTEERAVVEKTATPVERVRLGKEAVTTEETVTEEVRSERVEVDGDIDGDGDGDIDINRR